jgi:hypothetical protein
MKILTTTFFYLTILFNFEAMAFFSINENAAIKGGDKKTVCYETNVCTVAQILTEYNSEHKIEIIYSHGRNYFLVFENVNKPFRKHWSNYLTFADFGDGTLLTATKNYTEASAVISKLEEPKRLALQKEIEKDQEEKQRIYKEVELFKAAQERKAKTKYLEDNFGSKCSKNKANNVEYNKCLNDQDQIAKKEKAIQEAKQAEENKKKQLIADKQKAEEDKLNKILAAMKPEERRAYICEKTYGLRKGSDKFSECVYKILAADVELEKLELQKKLAEAQLETARANEAAARANAAASASTRNAPAYDPAIGRAAERANEIETARLAFELARQLNPQRYAPQQQNNIQLPKQQYCKLNPINNRISCYTTP